MFLSTIAHHLFVTLFVAIPSSILSLALFLIYTNDIVIVSPFVWPHCFAIILVDATM
jgi:hypothetical protein